MKTSISDLYTVRKYLKGKVAHEASKKDNHLMLAFVCRKYLEVNTQIRSRGLKKS